MSQQTTDIFVLGKSFTVTCPPEQVAQLNRVAEELNQRLEQLRQRTGLGSLEQLAVMAALNLINESMQSEQNQAEQERQMQQRINLLQNTIEQALSEQFRADPKTVEPQSPRPYTESDG
ncbi:cell division protein ZapA [Ferrimonas marina]|uniref:Cell division protein ZapA n=1 Tax=Ferrimonas marina TaxID=299255 RepID=A0A1M5ZF31_9GAMM|nr:cell division protein ZapA [Ferrimonas marina]SHI22850.1 cell division protein ZapA [Ferrimonas marina]